MPGCASGALVSAPHSSFVRPLLTDLYQISMAYAYYNSGRHECRATFDLYFRKCRTYEETTSQFVNDVLSTLPNMSFCRSCRCCTAFEGSFTVFAGLDVVLQFIQNYKFSHDDIEYIRTVLPPSAKEAFFTEYLASIDCSQVHVFARRDGSVACPSTPLLRIEGPLGVVQLLETTLLNLVGYASLVATNAARCRLAVGPSTMLVEFGLRRAQGPDGGMHASKYSYLGGFDGTSNVLAGFHYGVPVKGTHAHSFVQSFASLDDIPTDVSLDSADGTRSVSASDFCRRSCTFRQALLSDEDELHCCEDGELAAFVSYALA